jgi:transcriptional regulator with XRE-family HTH domain
MTFGDYVKETRLSLNIGLREFCLLARVDPSNWSKVERDRLSITDDREKLDEIASVLHLERGSSEWKRFFDLASISQKKIPEDVYSDQEVLDVLPVFFRTVRGDKPTPEELDKLIALIRQR